MPPKTNATQANTCRHILTGNHTYDSLMIAKQPDCEIVTPDDAIRDLIGAASKLLDKIVSGYSNKQQQSNNNNALFRLTNVRAFMR